MPDVLQLNRQEASEFFGINFLDEAVWRSEHCPISPGMILIITDGARGGRACLPAEALRSEASGSKTSAKEDHQGVCTWYEGIKTTMVDSTGAGDAFGSGFIAGLMLGKPTEEAIEWGKKQAASVVERIGAKAGLLARKEIEI